MEAGWKDQQGINYQVTSENKPLVCNLSNRYYCFYNTIFSHYQTFRSDSHIVFTFCFSDTNGAWTGHTCTWLEQSSPAVGEELGPWNHWNHSTLVDWTGRCPEPKACWLQRVFVFKYLSTSQYSSCRIFNSSHPASDTTPLWKSCVHMPAMREDLHNEDFDSHMKSHQRQQRRWGSRRDRNRLWGNHKVLGPALLTHERFLVSMTLLWVEEHRILLWNILNCSFISSLDFLLSLLVVHLWSKLLFKFVCYSI